MDQLWKLFYFRENLLKSGQLTLKIGLISLIRCRKVGKDPFHLGTMKTQARQDLVDGATVTKTKPAHT